MSAIDDATAKIIAFTASNDRSDSPEMREAAEIYASAAADVNSALAECRELADKGLDADAKNLAASYKPDLKTRIRLLKEIDFETWRNICMLYSWPMPVKINTESAQKIFNTAVDKNFTGLVSLWRATARDGTPAEKVALLRKIIDAAPQEKAASWKTNLVNAEHTYIPELIAEGRKFAESGNLEGLEKVYTELASGVMLSPVPDKEKRLLASALAELQKEAFNKEKTELLDTISKAYMAMDTQLLGTLLEQWTAFASTPGQEITPAEKRQIKQAEEFYTAQCTEKQKNELFTSLSLKLSHALDDNADINTIKKIYNELLATGGSIQIELNARYDSAIEAYMLEQKRKHIRHTVYAFCGAVLLAAAVWGAITLIQREREYREAVSSVEKLLAAHDFTAAKKIIADFKAKSPDLADRGGMRKLAADTEAMEKKSSEDDALFAKLLSEAETILSNSDSSCGAVPDSIAPRMDEMKKLEPERNAEDREKFRLFTQKFEAFREKCAAVRADSFRNSAVKLENSLKDLASSLAFAGTNPDEAEKKAAIAAQEYATLAQEYSDVPEKLRNTHLLAISALTKSFETSLIAEKARRALFKSLTKPANFNEYSKALETLILDPAYAADAEGNWKNAASALQTARDTAEIQPTAKMIENNDALKNAYSSLRSGASLPLAAELRKNIGGQGVTDSFTNALKLLAEMKDAFTRDDDLYEIRLTSETGAIYLFYSRTKPEFQFRGGQARPLSVDFELVLNPAKEAVAYSIGINYTAKTVTFNPMFYPPVRAVPENLPELENFAEMRKQRKTDFQKAEHFTFAVEAAKRLEAASKQGGKAFAKEILMRLDALGAKSTMNHVVRRELAMTLLKMYSLVSPDTEAASRAIRDEIAASGATASADDRLNPVYTNTGNTSFKKITEAISHIDTASMKRYADFYEKVRIKPLVNSPVPCGVISKSQNGDGWILEFFSDDRPYEAYILAPDNPQSVFTVIPRKIMKNGVCTKELLPGAYTGCVIYAARSSLGLTGIFAELDAEAEKLGLTPPENAFRPRKLPEEQENEK